MRERGAGSTAFASGRRVAVGPVARDVFAPADPDIFIRADLCQRLLRPAVSVAHRILGALLDVENEIQRQTRGAGSIGMRRFGTVADEVPIEVVR